MEARSSFIKEIKNYAEEMKLSVIKSDIDVAIEDAPQITLVMMNSYIDFFKKNVIFESII